MKHLKLITLAFVVVFATACKNDTKTTLDTDNKEILPPPPPPPPTAPINADKQLTINLSPKSDSNVEGSISFTEKDGVVTMNGIIIGLEEGEHAIHIHEKADCSSADGKSSGGHWNPTAQPHGKWGSEKGYHKGDIGNFTVEADGVGAIKMMTDEWCIGCGDENKDILGKAIIVHQGTDDFTSQPSGAAGARVSCAGIIE